MAKRIIAVAGATGNQGGGLVRAILADPSGEFTARALTRDPNSEKAQALAKMGIELVKADVDDVASLVKAYQGADAAYCVSFFWEHFSPPRETQQGRNQALAAKEAGLKHVIWSTFEDTRKEVPLTDHRLPTLQVSYKVPHFDAKADADRSFTEANLPVTFLYTSFYWENFIFFGMGPKPGSDGHLVITLPMGDKKLPCIAAGDIGGCAYGIFKRGQELVGKTVGIAGEHLTGSQIAAELTKALGQTVTYSIATPDAYRALGFPGAEDLGNMFQFKAEFQNLYLGNRPLTLSRELNPKLQTFAQWLAVNKERIPLS